jgi:hypothetical protein
MQPYNGSMFYKLYRALQDEGMPDEEMSFESNPTFVSDIGFFTLRFDQEVPQVVHFLVWKDKRSYCNGIRLYREVKKALIQMGFVRFIALVPDKFWLQLFRVWGKNVKMYAEKDNKKFYIIRIGRDIR